LRANNAFGKWWDDLKKHTKRRTHWVPNAKRLHRQLAGSRGFRLFTLCSREMIDVFTLIKEGVISHDRARGKINDVKFCEMDPEIFPEITDMIGYVDSGFLGSLDEIALFQDDRYTEKFTTQAQIDAELERLGEAIGADKLKRLNLKKTFLQLQDAFPFDFINLDYCSAYYPSPPDTMRINSAIERMVQWQSRVVLDNGSSHTLDRFLISVTCRFDKKLSKDAFQRMTRVVSDNLRQYPQYKIAVESDKARSKISNWARKDGFDFFLSAWPKELLKIVEQHQWRMEILGFAYYDRKGDSGKPYEIVSLICECSRALRPGSHEAQSLWALNRDNRIKIEALPKKSKERRELVSHLNSVVAHRNAQAKYAQRPLLPIVK